MKRLVLIGLSLAAFCGASTLAYARPPTVMNSPGYERRLQESRKELDNSPMTTAPVPVAKPKRTKKKHPN